MASYLSYFTSNSSAAPSQQQYSQAQPATNTWASTFSSRIATLRKALTKDSEEDDPENEDCSHVSNVLRAYYTQKGQALPPWLPPDPKKPQTAPPVSQQYGQYGNAYANPYGPSTHQRGSSGGGAGGGLSDLWDATPAPVQRPAPQSLRAPRPTPHSMRSSDNVAGPGSVDPYSGRNNQTNLSVRPLPSQRAGSFQNTPAASAPVSTRNDRLRARLQPGGSGRNSPAPNQPNANSYNDSGYSGSQGGDAASAHYSSASQPRSNAGDYDPYGPGGNYGNQNNPAYRYRPGGPR